MPSTTHQGRGVNVAYGPVRGAIVICRLAAADNPSSLLANCVIDFKLLSASSGLLEARGPNLDHPHNSQIKGSKYGNMRELRIQESGDPYRVFYAFDPRRMAILLMGGNKTGDGRFYERIVPQAERIYDQHLLEIGHGKKVR